MFLVSIPKLGSDSKDLETVEPEELLTQVLAEYRNSVSIADFEHEIFTSEYSEGPSFLILRKPGDKDPFSLDGTRWCLSAGVCDTAALTRSLTQRAGRLFYNEPVWGTYAAVFAEPQHHRVSAWNTIPATESIYYGQNQKSVFISNRPLLVSLALAGGAVGGVQLSQEYLTEYIMYGYSVTEQSPYLGVKIVPSNRRLEVTRGKTHLSEFPVGLEVSLPETFSVQDKASRLASAMRNAMDRCAHHLGDRDLQIRVSGGKDSRAILGLARGIENNVYGVTFGQSSDHEVKMSNYLTKLAGLSLDVSTAPQMGGETLREKVEISLATSDGIPLSEPHGSIYLGSNSKVFGEGIMLGQWPLMKGGAAQRFAYPKDRIEEIILGQGARIVDHRERRKFDQFFLDWIEGKNVNEDTELLYLFSRDFRSARWMLALTTQYDRDATVVYPLADSEIAAVSDALLMTEKVSQQAYFLALNKIWPECLSSPVVGSKWPFEAVQKQKGFREDSYPFRALTVEDFFEKQTENYSVTVPKAKTTEFLRATGTEMAQEIVTSPLRNLFQSILAEDFWTLLIDWSAGNQRVHLETSFRITIQWIWRVFVADIWFQRTWLRTSRNA